MAKLPTDPDGASVEIWNQREEDPAAESESPAGSTPVQKHLDDSFDEFFLSREGLLPEWVDG